MKASFYSTHFDVESAEDGTVQTVYNENGEFNIPEGTDLELLFSVLEYVDRVTQSLIEETESSAYEDGVAENEGRYDEGYDDGYSQGLDDCEVCE